MVNKKYICPQCKGRKSESGRICRTCAGKRKRLVPEKEIRNLLLGKMTVRDVATKYGVSVQAVRGRFDRFMLTLRLEYDDKLPKELRARSHYRDLKIAHKYANEILRLVGVPK